MTTGSFDFRLARIAVGGYDDAQDMRSAMMNRVRDLVRKKNEGISLEEPEDEKESRDFDSKYEDDNLPEIIEEMVEEDKFTQREYDYLDMMLEIASNAADVEDKFQEVMEVITEEDIYKDWLVNVNGVGVTLTARLLYQFGYCEDFSRVSKLWAYCGYAPDQKRERGKQLNYNPDAKTLGWLIADRIIMQGGNSMYKEEFYDPYKQKQVHRMESSSCQFCGEASHEHDPRGCDEFEATREVSNTFPDDADFTLEYFDLPDTEEDDATPPWNQQHAHNRAVRYLAKKFLKHYWAMARSMKDLETPDEWVITHGGHEKKTDTFENPFYAAKQVAKS